MNNSDYWRGRFAILEDAAQHQADQCVASLEDMYREAERTVQADLERWYGRFATNNGISLTEARKMLTTGQLEEFRWTVDQYIQAAQQANLSPEWIKKLENASARFHVSRLETIQIQIQQQMELLYGNQTDSIDELLKKVVSNGYTRGCYELQRGIGLGWDVTALNQQRLETLLSKPWTADNKTFRDRCWEGKANLVSGIQTRLTQALLRGDSLQKTTDAIRKQFGVARYKAGRLVHTETTYFNAVASRETYKEIGVEKVEIIETLDSHTCEICQPLDGAVIPMAQYEPGVTVPPFHPNCRGTTAPAIDPAIVGERAARNEDGTPTYNVPSNMKYTDWAKAFYGGGSKAGLTVAGAGSTIKTVDDCTTVEEVEELMKQQGWFNSQTINGTVYDTNETLTLKGCDLDSAKAIYKAHERVFTRLPDMVGNLNSVNARVLKGGTYAQCHVGLGHGGIDVNTRYFGDVAKLEAQYARDLAAGFHCARTQYGSIVVHELGHAVDDYLTNTLQAVGMKNHWQPKYVSAYLRPKVMKACGLKVSDTYSAVSGYATKDHFEWFAECFSEWVDSPDPRPVAKEFGKQLMELIGGLKP